MTPWLAVVGIGEDGHAGLSAAAKSLVDNAEIVFGGARHLALLPAPPAAQERVAWDTRLAGAVKRLVTMRGRRVCVLASGDPMHFGVGATLARHVPAEEWIVLPSASAFSLAAARMGWPLQRTICLSLHGRPVAALALHLAPRARLLLLTSDASTPAEVAALLTRRGFGDSRIVALAHMGGPRETRIEAAAAAWDAAVPDLHTLAVDCVAAPGATWHPRLAGLPDDAYAHDGKLSKREVRALALAKLMPHDGGRLWDIGAGCGSIGIEWLRAAAHAEAIALEPDAARRALAARNAVELGVPHLDIRDGHAPAALAGLPRPDAIFIGGGLSSATLDAAMAALPPAGRLVAHAVTLQSEALLLSAFASHGGELVRLAATRAEPVGGMTGWRPAMPVTQWAWNRP